MAIYSEDILKLALAILLGGLVGAEREFRDKSAGFRTIIFITFGATLFTMFSLRIGGAEDPVRIAANIVSGVGFLGAGTILRDGGRVAGLTTASTIWLAAALGMGIGGGYYLITAGGALLIFLVLVVFPRFEYWIDNLRDSRTYEIVSGSEPHLFADIEKMILESGLRITTRSRCKTGSDIMCTWNVYGSPHKHELLVEKLIHHEQVKEFRV